MRRPALALLLLSGAAGLGLGQAAWGISLNSPDFLWLQASHAGFLLAGAACGIAWALSQSLLWRWAWSLPWISGLRAGSASLLPCLLGFAWKLFQRPILPPPHDFPLRSLQIFMAALVLAAIFLSFCCMLIRLRFSAAFPRLAPGPAALRLGACLWIFFLLSGAWGWSWRQTGDQPHYLLMAQSLSQDHDLDLANNYAAGQWRAYYDRDLLEPQYPAQNGHLYTEHKPLLPLLAAPLFGWLGPLSGLWIVALIAAAGAGLLAWLLLAAGLDSSLALWGFALLALNAAWWTHAAAFFPDALSGLLLLTACAALAGQLPWALGCLSTAAMAWVSVRCYPAAAVLGFLILWQAPKRGWLRSAMGLGLIAASFILAAAMNRAQFGSADPSAAYHSIHKGLSDLFPVAEIPRQALGQWLDQEYGLLVWAPVFAFGLAGLFFWRKHPSFNLACYALPLLAYYLPVAAYWDWTGVMAPCRYLVPLLPFLALGACFAKMRLKGRAWILEALFALSCLEGLLVAVLPWLNYSKMDGKNLILKALESKLGLNLTGLFPSFMMFQTQGVIWALATAALCFLNFTWPRRAGSRDLLDPRAVNPARPGREQR